MAKKASIPIDNDGAPGVCTSYYGLRLRLTGDTGWQVLPNQYESPIVLNNLEDDVSYDLEVTRHCCEQTTSSPVIYTFTSTDT